MLTLALVSCLSPFSVLFLSPFSSPFSSKQHAAAPYCRTITEDEAV